MCRNLSVTLAFLVLPLIASAANPRFALKAGIATAEQEFNYTYLGSPDFDSRTGLDIGLSAEWPLLRPISLGAEVHYVQKGMVIRFLQLDYARAPTGRSISRLDNRVDYISLPLALRASMPLGNHRFFLLAGPRVDLKIGHEWPFEEDILYSEFDKSVIGAIVGVGAVIEVDRAMGLLFEANYHHDYSHSYRSHLLTVKNRSWQILIGIEFQGGG
ncbi:MAG TPA: porin family protein [Candidatus Deferrimicrobium sp.]|nr:porin family protein [Candidatus Deferrimicrobium sp.]